jgi:hypothetical protein
MSSALKMIPAKIFPDVFLRYFIAVKEFQAHQAQVLYLAVVNHAVFAQTMNFSV